LEPMSLSAAFAEPRRDGSIRRIDEFGRFYVRFTWLICPVLAFGVFLLGFRQKIGPHAWRPFAIAIAFTLPLLGDVPSWIFMPLGIAGAMAARSVVVLLLMMWSIGAMRISSRSHYAVEDSVAVAG
jgi:hypothetical protein